MLYDSNADLSAGGRRRLRETQVLLTMLTYDPDMICECRRDNRAAAMMEATIALACFGGLSFGEIEALHVEDFDERAGTVHVRRLRNRAGRIITLDVANRIVSLRANITEMLAAYIERHLWGSHGELMFPLVRSPDAIAAAEARRSRRRAAA